MLPGGFAKTQASQTVQSTPSTKDETLTIRVVKGKGLRNTELIGKQDPYVKFKLGKVEKSTKVHRNGGINPSWDQDIAFRVNESKMPKWVVQVIAMDKETFSDDKIGKTVIPLKTLIDAHGKGEIAYRIEHNRKHAGEIIMKCTYTGHKERVREAKVVPPMGVHQQAPGYPAQPVQPVQAVTVGPSPVPVNPYAGQNVGYGQPPQAYSHHPQPYTQPPQPYTQPRYPTGQPYNHYAPPPQQYGGQPYGGQPVYQQRPTQPVYQPQVYPQQPVYQQPQPPVYQSQQPVYQQQQQPVYQQKPVYGAPGQPVYQQPNYQQAQVRPTATPVYATTSPVVATVVQPKKPESKSVTLSGAKTSAVNGKYYLAGTEDGVPCYKHSSKHLYVMRHTAGGKATWWICLWKNGNKNNTDDYYFNKSGGPTPPVSGWIIDKHCKGRVPGPHVRLD
ncbi:hypothetical protein AAMO2058_001087300 [Amorphochlora amoebiformis]